MDHLIIAEVKILIDYDVPEDYFVTQRQFHPIDLYIFRKYHFQLIKTLFVDLSPFTMYVAAPRKTIIPSPTTQIGT